MASQSWIRRRLHFVSAVLAVVLLSLAAALLGQEGWEKRDSWQRPAEVMDALGVRPGSVVADVGAGTGYFTFLLAARVGSRGKVYAEDIVDTGLAEQQPRHSLPFHEFRRQPVSLPRIAGAAGPI